MPLQKLNDPESTPGEPANSEANRNANPGRRRRPLEGGFGASRDKLKSEIAEMEEEIKAKRKQARQVRNRPAASSSRVKP